jgi:hypothetical protein
MASSLLFRVLAKILKLQLIRPIGPNFFKVLASSFGIEGPEKTTRGCK